jgi:peptide/nickel transport system permease protein
MGRGVDVIMSIPSLIFALLILSILGTNTVTLILVMAVIYSPRVFRLTRAVAGNIVVMDYIEAAKLRGEGIWYLIRKEILPNSMAPLIAEFGLEFCFVFLLVAGLSFLGLGIQPPTADWGSMVRENATLISFGEITPLIPAGAIALLTVAVNFVVDWMLWRSAGLKE